MLQQHGGQGRWRKGCAFNMHMCINQTWDNKLTGSIKSS